MANEVKLSAGSTKKFQTIFVSIEKPRKYKSVTCQSFILRTIVFATRNNNTDIVLLREKQKLLSGIFSKELYLKLLRIDIIAYYFVFTDKIFFDL